MLKHHIHHPKHHNFTIKTPRERGAFLENPRKNASPPHQKKSSTKTKN
jgi:hypothetical protein